MPKETSGARRDRSEDRPGERAGVAEAWHIPGHVGFIPDGNRRWADARGLPRQAGYGPGVEAGMQLLDLCRDMGIPEASVYGFTRENVQRPAAQVDRFTQACAEFGQRAAESGAALRVLGDHESPVFPDSLRPFVHERSEGDIRVNLLANYSWQWDLRKGLRNRSAVEAVGEPSSPQALASADIPRVDLVVRWGARRRLSGFLPFQCAYADIYVIDALWPDFEPDQFMGVLDWYQDQEVSLGG